ncbi:tetratricopeptide repeat protein [Mumia flava]|uniref:Tetratricopeptide repeat protein n=1 Tax=Mumia flava TaxID=1348852 RepID=A0A0B2BG47_9ACTN|nr:tetratricopeptide repeat protein [Mumia flava]PJJ54020.1 tetratricopeptide repeat protein [Mumia flava]
MPATGSSFVRAEHYLDVGNPQACVDVLDEVAFDQDPVRAFELRSLALLRLERHDDALEAAHQGLRLDPENAALMFYAAQAAGRLGRPDADDLFAAVLRVAPGDAVTRCAYGLYLTAEARLPEAIEQLEAARDLEPSSNDVTLLEGRIAFHRGDWSTCRTCAQAVLAEDPENVEALLLDGAAADEQGDIAGAARRISQAAAATPDDRALTGVAHETQAQAHWIMRPFVLVTRVVPWWLQMVAMFLTVRGVQLSGSERAFTIVLLLALAWGLYGLGVPGLLERRSMRGRR